MSQKSVKIVHLPLKRASLSLHWNPESKRAIVGHLLTLSSTFGLDADGTASPRPVGGFISACKVWFNKTACNRLFDYSIGSLFEEYTERNSCGQNAISLIVNNPKKKVFCEHVSTCVLRQKDERLLTILLKSFCNCLSMHILDIVGYHHICDSKIGLNILPVPSASQCNTSTSYIEWLTSHYMLFHCLNYGNNVPGKCCGIMCSSCLMHPDLLIVCWLKYLTTLSDVPGRACK